MKTFWENASNTELYKKWRGGFVQGYGMGGLYNSKPLETFLSTELSDITSMHRSMEIGITDEV